MSRLGMHSFHIAYAVQNNAVRSPTASISHEMDFWPRAGVPDERLSLDRKTLSQSRRAIIIEHASVRRTSGDETDAPNDLRFCERFPPALFPAGQQEEC